MSSGTPRPGSAALTACLLPALRCSSSERTASSPPAACACRGTARAPAPARLGAFLLRTTARHTLQSHQSSCTDQVGDTKTSSSSEALERSLKNPCVLCSATEGGKPLTASSTASSPGGAAATLTGLHLHARLSQQRPRGGRSQRRARAAAARAAAAAARPRRQRGCALPGCPCRSGPGPIHLVEKPRKCEMLTMTSTRLG